MANTRALKICLKVNPASGQLAYWVLGVRRDPLHPDHDPDWPAGGSFLDASQLELLKAQGWAVVIHTGPGSAS